MQEGQLRMRLDATIIGRVQGVYFRQSTAQQAQALGVVGWVANQMDGSVRVCAEGDVVALRGLLEWLHQGPPAAHVERVLPAWSAAQGEFSGFSIWR